MRTRETQNQSQTPNSTRRALITYLPLGFVGVVFGSIAAAAFRFLRPVVTAASDSWVDVALLSELVGSNPVSKKVEAQHVSGWAITSEEHTVYILPANNNQTLSAVCPHEGCEVSWDQDAKVFACPCHESSFGPDGARIKGPAARGLDPLPARVQDGKLQVQYRAFENNSQEQIPRS